MFFKDKVFTKSIIKLAVPVALQNLITALLNIFDQLMVGLLPADPAIVDSSLSAVLLANQVVFIFQIVLFATCNTVNIFIAQYASSGKDELIPRRVGVALAVNAGIAVAATVLCTVFPDFVIGLFNPNDSYRAMAAEFLSVVAWSFIPMTVSVTFSFILRSIKRLNVPLIGNVVGVVCNVFLNYIFMFGKLGLPAYGLIGAAYGTIISRFIEAAIILAGMIIKKYPVLAKFSVMFKPDGQFNKQFVRMFFPILLNESSWAVSTAVFMFVYDKLPDSEVVLAAVNITSGIDKIVSVVMIGVGAAAGVIMGNTIAERDDVKLRKYTSYSNQFGIAAGLFVGVITVACAFFAPSLFKNASQAARDMAEILIILYGVTSVFRSAAYMLIVGILRSGGDTTFCMVAESLIIWLIAVPLVCVGGLVFKWNVYILFMLTMFAEILKCVVCYVRMRGTKWIKLTV